MSADNWGVCPQCHAAHEAKRNAAFAKADKAYGKVPREEYAAMLEMANDMPRQLSETTLRENCEIWTDTTGVFFISYSCSCKTCGFKFDFKHNEDTLAAKAVTP